jgi:hypothetical protein
MFLSLEGFTALTYWKNSFNAEKTAKLWSSYKGDRAIAILKFMLMLFKNAVHLIIKLLVD